MVSHRGICSQVTRGVGRCDRSSAAPGRRCEFSVMRAHVGRTWRCGPPVMSLAEDHCSESRTRRASFSNSDTRIRHALEATRLIQQALSRMRPARADAGCLAGPHRLGAGVADAVDPDDRADGRDDQDDPDDAGDHDLGSAVGQRRHPVVEPRALAEPCTGERPP